MMSSTVKKRQDSDTRIFLCLLTFVFTVLSSIKADRTGPFPTNPSPGRRNKGERPEPCLGIPWFHSVGVRRTFVLRGCTKFSPHLQLDARDFWLPMGGFCPCGTGVRIPGATVPSPPLPLLLSDTTPLEQLHWELWQRR